MKSLLALFVVPGLMFSPSLAQPESASPRAEPIVTVQFEGGTIKDFIRVLNPPSSPQRINIIVPEGAGDIEVPGVNLFNVPAATAVRALEFLTARNGNAILEIEELRTPGVPTSYALEVSPRAFEIKSQANAVRVFSLNSITRRDEASNASTGMKDDTVLTAIESAMQVQDSDRPPSMRYHRESGLLIVKGSHEQLEIAEQVVQKLERDVARFGKDEGPRRNRTIKLLFAPASQVAAALREAFPSTDGNSGEEISFADDSNSISATGTETFLRAIAAAIRVLDRKPEPSPELAELQMRQEFMARVAEESRRQTDLQTSKLIDERDMLADQLREVSIRCAQLESELKRAFSERNEASVRYRQSKMQSLAASIAEREAAIAMQRRKLEEDMKADVPMNKDARMNMERVIVDLLAALKRDKDELDELRRQVSSIQDEVPVPAKNGK